MSASRIPVLARLAAGLAAPALALATAAAQTATPAPGAAGPACRTYSAEEVRTLAGTGTGTIHQTCRFDPAANVLTCTQRHQGSPGTFTVTLENQYASRADFIDEVTVIPPVARIRSSRHRYTGTPVPGVDLTYTYDGQLRQTQLETRLTNGIVQTATYTSRDPAGRPTEVMLSQPGSSFSLRYAYDDRARTMTITGPGNVQTHTYDANGNLERTVAVGGGGTTTYSIAIGRTDRVCR